MRENWKMGAAIGLLAAGAGAAGVWRWNVRMPLKDYTRHALEMAVLDDEICRHALEGTEIAGKPVQMLERSESLQYRYHLFLKLNRRKSARTISEELEHLKLQRARQSASL